MQWSLASKDNKIKVQEVEKTPYLDEACTKIVRWTKNSDLDVSSFKGWNKKKFGTKNESLHENSEETRRNKYPNG